MIGFRCILKVYFTQYTDESDVRYEDKRIQDSKAFGLSSWKNGNVVGIIFYFLNTGFPARLPRI